MFHHSTSRFTALMILLSTAAIPQVGNAASYLNARPAAAKTSYTASLSDITQGDTTRTTRTLDWRQPTLQLYFDLPPAERTSEIILTLSADPLTRVVPGAPLQVQFNNAKPVPVLSNGNGFEARIPFNAALSRSHHNSLRITYPAPSGAECVTPNHGEWSVDLAASTLKIAGRAQRRNMGLDQVQAKLSQPALAPKTVGLIATGSNSTNMQALAAQGVALRTPNVPNFSITPKGNDFNIVMVKRDRLFDITDEPMILNSDGARIFVPRSRPTELIFTADTDAEILSMLEIFSTRQLPSTRRSITSLGELNLQSRLGGDIVQVDRKARLSELGDGQLISNYSGDNWASGAQSYRFNVADPAATGAELLLRLSTTEDVADTSKLRVALNGEILGATKLDRKRKSVAFGIKAGKLNATENVISILPDLEPTADYTCPNLNAGSPTFTIGQGSRLTLKKGTSSPVTELTQFTSTGGIFAETESYIVLPRGTRDYQAALGVLGQIAKAAGHGLTLADYTRNDTLQENQHRLIIGPASLAARYTEGSPKALRDALNGRASSGDNLLQASVERFASSGADDFAIQYAAKQGEPRRIQGGGVAALFSSGNGKLTGVISAASGESFIRTSKYLAKPAHWNALEGGVARWNGTTVVMAQTAQAAPGIQLPVVPPQFNVSDFDWPTFELPEFARPNFSWPEFNMPQVSLPSWARIGSSKSENIADNAPDVISDVVDPVLNKGITPRLKPTPIPKQFSDAASGLRGKFDLETPQTRHIGSFQDLRRETNVKWNASKSWFKAKTKSVKDADLFDDITRASDRLHDKVKPLGHSVRNSVKQNAKGNGVIQFGDRTFTAYGLLLMLAFGIVLFAMSMAGPSSRLGGRH